jgi:hypothetical protein
MNFQSFFEKSPNFVDSINDLLKYGEFVDDLDLLLNILKYFAKCHNVPEDEIYPIWSKLSEYSNTCKFEEFIEYDSEMSAEHDDDSEETRERKRQNKKNGKKNTDPIIEIEEEKKQKKRKNIDDPIESEPSKKLRYSRKHFVLTGPIAGGKTTFGNFFAKFLLNRGLTVQQPKEVSLMVQRQLELFYETRNELFLQQVITDTYKQIINDIENNSLKWNVDVIIFDRLHFDQEYFTNVLVKHENSKKYLFDLIKKVNFKFLIDKVIRLRPTKEIMYERQEKRKADRPWEKVDKSYLAELFDEHDRNADKIYPKHVVLNSSVHLCEWCRDYQNDKCEEGCNFQHYKQFAFPFTMNVFPTLNVLLIFNLYFFF